MSFNMDEDEWDAVIDVHLKGHFARRPPRRARTGGRSRRRPASRSTRRSSTPRRESGLYGNAGQANYAAAKAGIASMTIVMARELERIGVRVNAIAPVARTRLTEAVAGDHMKPDGGRVRPLRPENIVAAVACWLASDLAEGITGQVVQGAGRPGAAARRLAPAHRGDRPTSRGPSTPSKRSGPTCWPSPTAPSPRSSSVLLRPTGRPYPLLGG